MKHHCMYCGSSSNDNRDALVETGWSFVDLRTPIRKYFKACSNLICQNNLHDEINEIFGK